MGGEGGVGGFAYLPAVGEGFQVVQEGVVPVGGVGDAFVAPDSQTQKHVKTSPGNLPILFKYLI